VISSLLSVFMPLPFLFLELVIGLVQATVFSLLTLVYLSIMTTKPHGEAHGADQKTASATAHA
jgi:F-type H+-transporting ATPase subunit a